MAFSFFQKIGRAIAGKSRVDDDTLDAIEEALVESDMGVDTTLKVIDALEERVSRDKYMSFDELVGDFYRLVYGQEISEEEMAVMQEIGAKAGVVDEAH